MVKQWHPHRSTPLDPRRRAPPPPTHLPLTRSPLLRAGARRCFPGEGGGGWCASEPQARRPSGRHRRAWLLRRCAVLSTRWGKLERRERREKKKMVKLALVGPTRSNLHCGILPPSKKNIGLVFFGTEGVYS